jgi:hypothetical protein
MTDDDLEFDYLLDMPYTSLTIAHVVLDYKNRNIDSNRCSHF